ncbi:MAG TPA: hypothetical protein VF450_10165, partial [Noviherbaspirillum sp.]
MPGGAGEDDADLPVSSVFPLYRSMKKLSSRSICCPYRTDETAAANSGNSPEADDRVQYGKKNAP